MLVRISLEICLDGTCEYEVLVSNVGGKKKNRVITFVTIIYYITQIPVKPMSMIDFNKDLC